MFSISVFIGDQSNTKQGELRNYETFEDLAKPFKKCTQGKKHSSYFVRGALEPMERKNKNMISSRLLVIDADMGMGGKAAPAPYIVHRKLKLRGINHFLYTSHSHSETANKFRVVVPCQVFIQAELEELMRGLLKGLEIGWVKEMGVMTQPWFTPTRDDVGDGQFKFYEYHEGQSYEQEIKAKSKAQEEEVCGQTESGSQAEEPQGLDQLHENIRTGSELHESLRTLTFQWVRDGMSSANAKAMAKSVMNGSAAAGTERWQTRYDDIDRMVDGVENSDEEFELDKIETRHHNGKMPRPPGMLGELYDAAYDFLLYQYPEVAMASAVGVVAGIAGRRFNMAQPIPAGLNVFLTVIASTGCGKDRINDFANLCIRGGEGVKSYASFIGPSYFTSPKAIINQFDDARSRLCIVSEAGMMLKVKSGNVEGTTAFILDALQCSHTGGYTKSHAYSSNDDSMPSLRAMAMTIVSESTPDQLYDAYQQSGALTSGYLPRQTLLKIGSRQTVMNRHVKNSLPEALGVRMNELLETCSAVQAEADPKAFMLMFEDGLEDDFYEYSTHYNEMSAEAEGIDAVKQHMATRAAQKACKLAGIATVFNKRRDADNALIVEKREWEWAKSLCDYEYDHITSALSGLGTDQGLDNAVRAVYQKLISICDDSIKDKKCKIDAKHRMSKVVPYSSLRIACKNNTNVTSINDSHGRMVTGLDKVLKHMEDNKALRFLDRDPLGGRSNKLVKVLPGMVEFIRPFGE